MKQKLLKIIPYTLILLALWGLSFARSQSIEQDGISLLVPVNCPVSGCAAGQRLNIRLDFTVTPSITNVPNTLVCVSAPADGKAGEGTNPWADFSNGSISTTGLVSGIAYTPGDIDNACASALSATELLITSANASIPNATTDQLTLNLRINKTTDLPGTIKFYFLQRDSAGTGWLSPTVHSQSIPVAPASSPAFVAVTAAQCGSNAPCFLNSGDDLPGGIGTGLKDAVDAFDTATNIILLSSYSIQSQTVLVNKPHIIQGSAGSMLTYTGDSCASPMIELAGSVTLRDLTINDGNCTSPSRDLVKVSSSQPVTIQGNSLTNGKNAILLSGDINTSQIVFNEISNNSGFGILRVGASGEGNFTAVANNIYANQPGSQVDCQSHGLVDHNFWGAGISPSTGTINCTFTNGKHLGTAILAANPGVQAVLRQVTSTESSSFDGAISYLHTSGIDFGLYIVNHGVGSAINVPFASEGTNTLFACSNYYDVFTSEDASGSDLALTFKYDRSPACVAEIESSQYCGQANSANYPLRWYDPVSGVTALWDKVGEAPNGVGHPGLGGQETSCDLVNNEITVSIDASGRPNLADDLHFVPFVVGVPLTDGVYLDDFSAAFTTDHVVVSWSTSREVNISGFYVLGSALVNNGYSRISALITGTGNQYSGMGYTFNDTELTPGQIAYYKIEVVGVGGETISISEPVSVTIPDATATASATATSTHTSTSTHTATSTHTSTSTKTNTVTATKTNTATATKTATKTMTRTSTRTPTRTYTYIVYRSNTPIRSVTPTLTRTPTPNRTQTSVAMTNTKTLPVILTATSAAAETMTATSLAPLSSPTLLPSDTAVTTTMTVTLPPEATSPGEPSITPTFKLVTKTVLTPSDNQGIAPWLIIFGGGVIGLVVLGFIGWIIFKTKLG